MLVVTRKKGESIRIGDNVELVVLKIIGNRIQLGVKAPRNVHILRGELGSQETMQNAYSLARK